MTKNQREQNKFLLKKIAAEKLHLRIYAIGFLLFGAGLLIWRIDQIVGIKYNNERHTDAQKEFFYLDDELDDSINSPWPHNSSHIPEAHPLDYKYRPIFEFHF